MSWHELPLDLRRLAEAILTERQLEVIHDQADGLSVRYTARRLHISVSTVQGHRKAAHTRLIAALQHQVEPDSEGEAA